MVERFTMHGAEGGGYSWKINQWGNWVRSSDYDNVAEENRKLRVYAQEATKAITGLTAGGSEFFGKQIGDIYTADLQFCIEHVRERFKGAMDARLENAKLQRENRDLRAKLETVEVDTLERCAKVAETRHEAWRMPHPDDAKPGEVCDDISACSDIAAAIRSLKDKDQQNG